MNPERTPRSLTQRQALIFLLRDGRWHTMKEMIEAGGYRYSARVHELREAGYTIEKKHVFASLYEYRWTNKPGQLRLSL